MTTKLQENKETPNGEAASNGMLETGVVKFQEGFNWDGIPVHPYKEDGTHFKSITRQTLLEGDGDLPVEFRYFEVQPGGHSTLERHLHQHAVLIIRGSGDVFLKDQVHPISTFDMVSIAPMTWHQFRATGAEPLGFFCVVSQERDRPERPNPQQADVLKKLPGAGEFIRL